MRGAPIILVGQTPRVRILPSKGILSTADMPKLSRSLTGLPASQDLPLGMSLIKSPYYCFSGAGRTHPRRWYSDTRPRRLDARKLDNPGLPSPTDPMARLARAFKVL